MSLVLLSAESLQRRQRELVKVYSISATAANMEVSKISAGVKEVILSFTTLAFFTTCLGFFCLTVTWAVVRNLIDQFHSDN